MAGRIQKPAPYPGGYAGGPTPYVACGGRGPRHDPRLEQDMDAELEGDVEYFEHPVDGRVRLRDVLVCPPEAVSIAEEQEATETGC